MNDKIEIRSLSRGVVSKLFNDQVRERYSDNETLLNACLMRDWDTHPELQVKQNLFYFTLNNFVPVYEEKVYMRNKVKTDLSPWMMIHIKFKEEYIKVNGVMTKLGQRRQKVSNIDLSQVNPDSIKKAFDGKSFIYGSKYVTYNFNNGKEIQFRHIDNEAMGIDLISSCLPFTIKSTQHEGELKDNILTVNVPKNTPKIQCDGLRGYIWKVTFHEKDGKKTNQISRVLISNNARSKK